MATVTLRSILLFENVREMTSSPHDVIGPHSVTSQATSFKLSFGLRGVTWFCFCFRMHQRSPHEYLWTWVLASWPHRWLTVWQNQNVWTCLWAGVTNKSSHDATINIEMQYSAVNVFTASGCDDHRLFCLAFFQLDWNSSLTFSWQTATGQFLTGCDLEMQSNHYHSPGRTSVIPDEPWLCGYSDTTMFWTGGVRSVVLIRPIHSFSENNLLA